MMTIALSQGFVARVDDDDFDFLNQWKWTALVSARTVYAHRRPRNACGKPGLVLMHRLIAGTPAGMVTDHIDGNGLNNTRANLRVATQQQNLMNRRPQRGGSCSIKGVWRDDTAPRKPWRSAIRLNGKLKYLGRFECPQEAGAAYASAAAELFGEFHRITDGETTL